MALPEAAGLGNLRESQSVRQVDTGGMDAVNGKRQFKQPVAGAAALRR